MSSGFWGSQPRNFEERRVLDIKNLRELREKSVSSPSRRLHPPIGIFSRSAELSFERAAEILKFAFYL